MPKESSNIREKKNPKLQLLQILQITRTQNFKCIKYMNDKKSNIKSLILFQNS